MRQQNGSNAPAPEGLELWGIVVAGGSGARFGQRKQLLEVAGKRLLDWALEALRPVVTGLVVVVSSDLVADDGSVPAGSPLSRRPLTADVIAVGGDSRSESVRAGLRRLPSSATHVLIHDAARPLASPELVGRVVGALLDADADAVVPVVPLTDTLRRTRGGPADRDEFVAVQTPQGFALPVLLEAHATEPEATDDASLIDAGGGRVLHVAGDPLNFKITVAHDVVAAEVLLRGRA